MICREKVLLILAPTPKYNPNQDQKIRSLMHMHETEAQGLDNDHLEVLSILISRVSKSTRLHYIFQPKQSQISFIIFFFTESVSSNLIDFNTEIPQPSDSTSSNAPLHGGAPTSFFSSDSSSQQHPITGYLFRMFCDYLTYLRGYKMFMNNDSYQDLRLILCMKLQYSGSSKQLVSIWPRICQWRCCKPQSSSNYLTSQRGHTKSSTWEQQHNWKPSRPV